MIVSCLISYYKWRTITKDIRLLLWPIIWFLLVFWYLICWLNNRSCRVSICKNSRTSVLIINYFLCYYRVSARSSKLIWTWYLIVSRRLSYKRRLMLICKRTLMLITVLINCRCSMLICKWYLIASYGRILLISYMRCSCISNIRNK